MTMTNRGSPAGTVATSGPGGGFSPARMMEVELTEPLPTVTRDGQHRRVWVLGRLHTEPVGMCTIPLTGETLTPSEFGALLWPALHEQVTERFAVAGLPPPAGLAAGGLAAEAAAWPFLRRRRLVMAAAPSVSVVVCTRDRADQLAVCLDHLDRQEYPRFEVVVVDNAPVSDAVRALVAAREAGVTYRYVVEPRGGLSWARNAGIAAASCDVIAFLDDDDEPDPHWLAAVAGGFARGDDIGCVTGMTVPARLDTQAQELFEQFGGHCGSRGFVPDIFSRDGAQSPLFPLPPFGAGANMAFRREALARIGGFDVALGAGTPARASEDTLAFTLVLLAGYRIVYEPAALMRHHHRRDIDSLGDQLYGYGVGLTAYYAALIRHKPSLFPALARLGLRAAAYLWAAASMHAAAPQDLAARLNRRKLRGMLAGPAAYVRSVCRQGRVAVPRPRP
jgi:glycosyltransferase involved in cell wall biosynthesis